MTNTAGIASTLIQLAIAAPSRSSRASGGACSPASSSPCSAGRWLAGRPRPLKSGTSSTVTARFYGLGTRGSALASLIFAFMILGFLALENALLYYAPVHVRWAPTC